MNNPANISQPEDKSFWTHSGGKEVQVIMCCSGSDSDDPSTQTQEKLVIYSSMDGKPEYHPLKSWYTHFRPSKTQEAINFAAESAWAMAIDHAVTAVEEIEPDTDNLIQVTQVRNVLLRIANSGPDILRSEGVAHGDSNAILQQFSGTCLTKLCQIYDAALRAKPVAGFLYSTEILGSNLQEDAAAPMPDLFITLAEKYVSLLVETGRITPDTKTAMLANIIAWPIVGFPS